MSEMQDRMRERLEKRMAQLSRRAAKVRERILQGKIAGEEGRLWLDTFAKGEGLDICCGDMVVGDMGLDGSPRLLGSDHLLDASTLTTIDSCSLDYIVTNYMDAMANPLQTLREWHRVLKPTGRLAIICANAHKYGNPKGPLANAHRQSLFTPRTLEMYLERAQFQVLLLREEGKELRASARPTV